jgi:nitroreductase
MTFTLTPDELLSTTRAVRRRLDLDRPVGRETIEECIRLAQQAPSSRNSQPWHFVVVTDEAQRARVAEVYRAAKAEPYRLWAASLSEDDVRAQRMMAALMHLADNLQRVPVIVVPCVQAAANADPTRPGPWDSVIQAAWSFMLAARARGLGSTWTTVAPHEPALADVLGIPHPEVLQAALIPVAYTLGTDFRPGFREPLDQVVHWDRW